MPLARDPDRPHDVETRIADSGVLPGPAVEAVARSVLRREAIVAGTAEREIAPGAWVQLVVAALAVEPVGARPAVEVIGAAPAAENVVAAVPRG